MSTAAITGTATANIVEGDVVAGGKTIIITLTGDTWIAEGGTPLFSDGFETNDFSQWSLPKLDTNGDLTIVTSPVRTGTYAASARINDVDDFYSQEDLGSNYTTIDRKSTRLNSSH